jgi:hypothetical protein
MLTEKIIFLPMLPKVQHNGYKHFNNTTNNFLLTLCFIILGLSMYVYKPLITLGIPCLFSMGLNGVNGDDKMFFLLAATITTFGIISLFSK